MIISICCLYTEPVVVTGSGVRWQLCTEKLSVSVIITITTTQRGSDVRRSQLSEQDPNRSRTARGEPS